jgi:hypothetical protein
MSQSIVTLPPNSNRLSGSKDNCPASSVSTRLRSNRQAHGSGSSTAKDTAPPNQDSRSLDTPADESQAVETTPARMTRKRIAVRVPPDESSLQRADESPPQSATSAEAVSQICLCQPDPKIPRPRNGMCRLSLFTIYHARPCIYPTAIREYVS